MYVESMDAGASKRLTNNKERNLCSGSQRKSPRKERAVSERR